MYIAGLDIHDVLPADARFKVLVFAGDTADAGEAEGGQRARVEALAREMGRPERFLRRFGKGKEGYGEVFDVLAISSARKQEANYTGE